MGSVSLLPVALAGSPVCQRSQPIRSALEREFSVPCEQIEIEDLHQIVRLIAYPNGPQSLLAGDMDDFINLRTLYITGNESFSQITPEVLETYLRPVKDLEALSMRVEVPSLPAHTFSGMTKLNEVDLQLRNTATIPENAFDDLAAAHEFIFYLSPTSELKPRHFEKLVRMDYLYLEVNAMTLEADTFKFNPELKYLGLINLGAVQYVGSSIYQLSNLRHMVLGGLTAPLPIDFLSRADQLKSFLIQKSNNFAPSAEFFRDCASLESLYFYETDLGPLPMNMFQGLPSLVSLGVRGSLHSLITKGHLSGLSKLKNLDLGGVRLELTPDFFDGLPSLTNVSMSFSGLTEIPPKIFSGLRDLKVIYLDGNPFVGGTLLNLDFAGLDRLYYVGLSGTGLSAQEVAAVRQKWPKVAFPE